MSLMVKKKLRAENNHENTQERARGSFLDNYTPHALNSSFLNRRNPTGLALSLKFRLSE